MIIALTTARKSTHRRQAKLPILHLLLQIAGDKAKLLQLLAPIQLASEACAWLKNIRRRPAKSFIPLRRTPQDAVRFLQDVETMEGAGLVIRMLANWLYERFYDELDFLLSDAAFDRDRLVLSAPWRFARSGGIAPSRCSRTSVVRRSALTRETPAI
jgi:hypothetical protein